MRMRTSHVRLLLTACLLTTGAVAFPAGTAVALADPDADFDWTPKPVVAGAPVTLVSTSTPDDDGDDDDDDTPLSAITHVEWDLDGRAICDGLTLSGTTCTTTAPAAGDWEVRVTVTDLFLDSDSEKKRIEVEAAPTPTEPGAGAPLPPTSNGTGRPRLLSPFPVVTVGGTVTEDGTSIDLLTVRAPRGARVLVRCRGEACPLTRVSRVVRRAQLRLKSAERLMPAGVVLEVLVRRGDRIGKFTRLKMRRDRRPRRTDGCVWPGTAEMAPCPDT
jgi:hypothetical protein